MVSSKEGNVQCSIQVNGVYLDQVTSYRYLGSLVTEDGRSEVEIKTRIAMAKRLLEDEGGD